MTAKTKPRPEIKALQNAHHDHHDAAQDEHQMPSGWFILPAALLGGIAIAFASAYYLIP